jgi:hypothetical protein
MIYNTKNVIYHYIEVLWRNILIKIIIKLIKYIFGLDFQALQKIKILQLKCQEGMIKIIVD